MRTIQLTRGKVTTVDDSDYQELAQHSWYAMKTKQPGLFYAARSTWELVDGKRKKGCVLMHRQLMKADEAQLVDHRNGDGLDNQRGNLRLCSNAENLRNRRRPRRGCSHRWRGYTFVSGKSKPWRAQAAVGELRANGSRRLRSLGYFVTEEEAAHAYDKAVKAVYGAFASLNFPEE